MEAIWMKEWIRYIALRFLDNINSFFEAIIESGIVQPNIDCSHGYRHQYSKQWLIFFVCGNIFFVCGDVAPFWPVRRPFQVLLPIPLFVPNDGAFLAAGNQVTSPSTPSDMSHYRPKPEGEPKGDLRGSSAV